MSKAPTTHIADPDRKDKSLCGMVGVAMGTEKDATCKRCQRFKDCAPNRHRKLAKKVRHKAKASVGKREAEPLITERQLAFASHPLVITNPSQAARDVGYSESTAKNVARKMQRQLSPLIRELQQKRMEKLAIGEERIQNELACMAFANVLDYVDVDEETGEVSPKAMSELSRAQAAAIVDFETEPVHDEDGNVVKYVVSNLKLADKQKALVELGKTLGMFTNKIQIDDKRTERDLSEFPTDALEAAEKMLLEAARKSKGEQQDRSALPGEYTRIK